MSQSILFIASCLLAVPATRAAQPCSLPLTDKSPVASIVWLAPSPGEEQSLGSIHLKTPGGADYVSQLQATGAGRSLAVIGTTCQAGGAVIDLKLDSAAPFTVNLRPGTDSALQPYLDISSASGQMTSVSVGQLQGPGKIDQIPIPYLPWPVNRLQATNWLANLYFDWDQSNASSLSNGKAQYQADTSGHRNPLKERLVVLSSSQVSQVLPQIRHNASPYRSELLGRTVIDIWDVDFRAITNSLALLKRKGVSNCVVIIHEWQYAGFDNALPQHYPAGESFGGDAELAKATSAARSMKCLVALHENYVDYYPNFPLFNPRDVALNPNGTPATSWTNPNTHIQSLASKPNLMVKLASTQSAEIHHRYGTTASYIDVNSAVQPWWRTDFDQSSPTPGSFHNFVAATQDLWNFERVTHGGPVLGEGKYHMFWAGLIDGAEAQFGADPSPTTGSTHPLFVDFDLLRIFPLSANHGMGYYAVWKGTDGEMDTHELDTYRMQEVIFGHAPFVGTQLWHNPIYALLEQHLVGPVSAHSGTSPVNKIAYQVDGNWQPTEVAVAAHNWARPLVQHANGDIIVANGTPTALKWEGLDIPPSGWAAKGRGLMAYTATVDGRIVDFSQTPTSIFANPRNPDDYTEEQGIASPSATLLSVGQRSFTLRFQWAVKQSAPNENLKEFVHFVPLTNPLVNSDGQKPAMQADRFPAATTANWLPGQTLTDEPVTIKLPDSLPDGAYRIFVGLYLPASGQRFPLACQIDAEKRCTVADLLVSNHGSSIALRPPDQKNPSINPINFHALIDFGPLKTDHLVILEQSGPKWSAHPYSSSQKTTLWLKTSQFPRPDQVICEGTPTPQRPKEQSGSWQIELDSGNSCTWGS